MKIGELADKTGFSVESIRFYEKEKLLPEVFRNASNYREYGPLHLKRLLFIRHCRYLDMSLNDIRTLIGISENGDRDADKAHFLVHEHLKEIDKKMKALERLKKDLLSLESKCGGHGEDKECGLMHELRDGYIDYPKE